MTASTDEARLIRRYWLQVACAAACAVLTIAAAVLPTWIEGLTGLEPDGGSGALEWLLAVAAGALSVALGVLAYRTRRRLTHAHADRPRGRPARPRLNVGRYDDAWLFKGRQPGSGPGGTRAG